MLNKLPFEMEKRKESMDGETFAEHGQNEKVNDGGTFLEHGTEKDAFDGGEWDKEIEELT